MTSPLIVCSLYYGLLSHMQGTVASARRKYRCIGHARTPLNTWPFYGLLDGPTDSLRLLACVAGYGSLILRKLKEMGVMVTKISREIVARRRAGKQHASAAHTVSASARLLSDCDAW